MAARSSRATEVFVSDGDLARLRRELVALFHTVNLVVMTCAVIAVEIAAPVHAWYRSMIRPEGPGPLSDVDSNRTVPQVRKVPIAGLA